MVALFRGTDNSPKELFVYHTAGYDGLGGGSYIDTVICRDRDSNSGWVNAGDGTLERRDYYCHNWRGDVVCLITSSGGMVEWIRYSAYGEPCLIINGDTNGDFTVNSADTSNINNNWSSSNYPTGDFNLNGTIDTDDLMNVIVTQWNKTGGWGLLTYGGISGTIANRKGYAGYEHLAALTRTKWDVRFRVLESVVGRWNRRDPVGYSSGSNLSIYVRYGPLANVDPMGTITSVPSPPQSLVPPSVNCGAQLNPALGDPEVQQRLREVRDACGCLPTITCTNCSSSSNCGSASPSSNGCPRIKICVNNHGAGSSCGDLKDTLIHELVHARQYCEVPSVGILDNCEEHICMEVEAYDLDHSCDNWAPFFPSKDDCLCCRACISARAGFHCIFGGCERKCKKLLGNGKCVGGHYVN